MLSQCPIALASGECTEVYNILKSTLLSEMGGAYLPSALLEELNVLFVYRDIIQKAESTCKKE